MLQNKNGRPPSEAPILANIIAIKRHGKRE